VRSYRMADAAVSIFACGSLAFSESSLLAKLQFFARNVPEVRFQWSIQMKSLLENLRGSLDRNEDCIISLSDLKLRATVFRTAFSLSILESTGFIVDVRYNIGISHSNKYHYCNIMKIIFKGVEQSV
jgi:hypothetical protein